MQQGITVPSASRTASVATIRQTNADRARGVRVVIDMTAVPGAAPSIVVTIVGIDPVSGKEYTLLASAAIVGVSTVVLVVYPTIAASPNLIAQTVLPENWGIKVDAGNANACTYSIGSEVLP